MARGGQPRRSRPRRVPRLGRAAPAGTAGRRRGPPGPPVERGRNNEVGTYHGGMPAPPPAPELARLRWPEIEEGPRRLLVVPVGSLEQHGPHLPLDTDTRIAVAVARRACAGRAGVALAPAFCVGASGEHADFPGTLSIGTEALTICLIELGRHASLHWPALLLVNGHGGNAAAVEAAIATLRYEGRAAYAWHAGLPEG